MNFTESFRSLYNSQKADALQSSLLVRENGLSHFWVKCSVKIDGLRSVETFVYSMRDSEGIISTYRKGAFLERHDEDTIDLTELAELAASI